MIPFLIFLLTTAVLGAVVYIYLHRKQDKLVPKDKYDEAWDQLYRKRKLKRPIGMTESSYLLIRTFGVALFVNSIIASVKYVQPFSIKELLFVYPVAILFSPLFPLGLGVYLFAFLDFFSLSRSNNPFTNNAISSFVILILYVVYPTIILLGIYVRDRRVFSCIYMALIVLLIMNISGCALTITPHFLSGLN